MEVPALITAITVLSGVIATLWKVNQDQKKFYEEKNRVDREKYENEIKLIRADLEALQKQASIIMNYNIRLASGIVDSDAIPADDNLKKLANLILEELENKKRLSDYKE